PTRLVGRTSEGATGDLHDLEATFFESSHDIGAVEAFQYCVAHRVSPVGSRHALPDQARSLVESCAENLSEAGRAHDTKRKLASCIPVGMSGPATTGVASWTICKS